jgi:hypothetical protein
LRTTQLAIENHTIPVGLIDIKIHSLDNMALGQQSRRRYAAHAVDQHMLDLIEDMGGNAIRSGLWT